VRTLWLVLLVWALAACIDDDRPDARIPLGPEVDAPVADAGGAD